MQEYTPLLTIAGPILIALITGWFSYAAGQRTASTAAGAAVTEGFKVLVKTLQEERVELTKVVDQQSAVITKQSEKIVGLEGEIRGLRETVSQFRVMLIQAGVPLPEIENRS